MWLVLNYPLQENHIGGLQLSLRLLSTKVKGNGNLFFGGGGVERKLLGGKV